MSSTTEDNEKTRNTFLFAVLLLFFTQLVGMWIESIYRLNLIKLAPGKELYAILLMLLPLAVFMLSEKRESIGLWLAMVGFVAARVMCPQMGAVGQIIVAGVGTSLFLIILAYAFSTRYTALKGEMGQAIGIAVLLSVGLRSWGSSVDISTQGTTAGLSLGCGLAGLALSLFRSAMACPRGTVPQTTVPGTRLLVSMLGLFANLTLVYLVFASPAVVCAWTGYGQLGMSGLWAAGCVVVAFAVTLLLTQRLPSPGWRLAGAWNVLLIVLLVGALFAGRPVLPVSSASPAVFVNGDAPFTGSLLYLVLLLAPIVMFNVRHIAGFAPCARPRNAILPVLAGMGLLFAVTMLLIFSNVWGYVPHGPMLRNCFYLPFLVAGAGMLLPWMLRQPQEQVCQLARDRLFAGTAPVLATLAMVGAWANLPVTEPAVAKRELTILTYNMQQGSHLSGDRNYQNQLELLRRLNPDIVGLQECDTARPSGGNVDAVRYLAESLGYHAYYGPGSIAGSFGAAILSRYPIKNGRTFYTYSDSDEVGTAVAEIDVGGTTIAFFSAHPSGAEGVMNSFVNALKGEAGKYARVIAVGDYNFTAREPYFASLSQLLQDSATQLGEAKIDKHGGKGLLADEIDHIFVSRNFRVLESHYLPPPESQTDHPAHWSVVTMDD